MKVVALTHVITAADFDREIRHLVSILESGGYSTKGMDFTDIVARRLGDAFTHSLTEAGARIKNHSWELKADRSLRIKVYLPYEADLDLIRGLVSQP